MAECAHPNAEGEVGGADSRRGAEQGAQWRLTPGREGGSGDAGP